MRNVKRSLLVIFLVVGIHAPFVVQGAEKSQTRSHWTSTSSELSLSNLPKKRSPVKSNAASNRKAKTRGTGYSKQKRISDAGRHASPLLPDEEIFANRLSPLHKRIFSEKFSKRQRAAALSLVEAGEHIHEEISADEAVETILRRHRKSS